MKNVFILIFFAIIIFCVGFSQDKSEKPRFGSTSSPEFGKNKKHLIQDFQGKRRFPSLRVDFPTQRDNHFFPGERGFSNARHPFPPPSANAIDSVQEAWVSHYASGLAPGYDIATAIATDNAGNVYVTGYSTNPPFGVDYFTVKYDPAGIEEWFVRYDNGGDDVANALVVDSSGNVYVTGGSDGSGTNEDYATIKYNSAGIEQWVARYDGPGISTDRATALAVDGSGNVYVTGWSWESGTSDDYATVKYNSDGVEQWVARYNSPADDYDVAQALSIDNSGNVYVTGYSGGSGTSYDYATVKYNFAGVEQWVARYNGPDNAYDQAQALAVNDSGNVYVTGYSQGSGTSYDYATVKYDSVGMEQWVARYNGPDNNYDEARALAVDDSGYVYVTGYSQGSGTSYDYATVKYNSVGVEQWVARYNNPNNNSDVARTLSIDNSGNVYVTGSSIGSGTNYDYATVKYDSVGVEQWVARYNGPGNNSDVVRALSIDESGNVYVTGYSIGSSTSYDYATIKYDETGVQQWVVRYNGLGTSNDIATAMAMDNSGNVYVTGKSRGSNNFYDYSTVKYDALGVEQWVARYNGPGNSDDEATAIAVDDYGNVVVTGQSINTSGDYDYTTVMYSSEGVEQWEAHYNGPGNSDDWATAIAVDDSGKVYVTGYSMGLGTNDDYATIKYNSAGEQQWVARYNGPDNFHDRATDLTVDGSGNVYATGKSFDSNWLSDYATVKYNSDGVEQWVSNYSDTYLSHNLAEDLAVDDSGYVYVTGWSWGSSGYSDYATVKYDSNGVEQWVARYDGPDNMQDGAENLALDNSGNVYVTGGSFGIGTSSDYATVKYDAAGVQQWVARYNGSGNNWDEIEAIVIDESDNVYVTGKSWGGSNNYDFVTIKYNAEGIDQWGVRYEQPGNSSDEPIGMALDNSGNVCVAGLSQGTGWQIYTTIKYIQTPTGVAEVSTRFPKHYRLFQNYPNPFNPTTTIEFSLPTTADVSLVIYNVTGQVVERLVDHQSMTPGSHSVEWAPRALPSGVYFYHLTARGPSAGSPQGQAGQGFAQSRKMVLMK